MNRDKDIIKSMININISLKKYTFLGFFFLCAILVLYNTTHEHLWIKCFYETVRCGDISLFRVIKWKYIYLLCWYHSWCLSGEGRACTSEQKQNKRGEQEQGSKWRGPWWHEGAKEKKKEKDFFGKKADFLSFFYNLLIFFWNITTSFIMTKHTWCRTW